MPTIVSSRAPFERIGHTGDSRRCGDLDPVTETGKRRMGNKHGGTAVMSQSEIGKMFGISLQSIQSVEYRALKKIRREIERLAAEEGKTVREWLFDE
jgi:hypothetical protein